MSYESVINFKANAKQLSIDIKVRESNCYDWSGRREVIKSHKHYDSVDEFKKELFSIADGALTGSLRFPSSSTFAKRLSWLDQNGLIKHEVDESNVDWKTVERTELAYKVLAGLKRVKPKKWIICNDDKQAVKFNRSSVRLVINKGTKFYSKDLAKQALADLSDPQQWEKKYNWAELYNLQVQEIN